jgi:AcrR family transcriptional regulator
MRYEKGHRDATRQRILDVASRRFREDGVAAAGVAGLMADAGLTNGAFYTHFESKEHLVREVLLDVLEQRREAMQNALESGAGLEEGLRQYLSASHRDAPGRGCPVAALAAEVARHPAKTRAAFTKKIEEIIDLIARLLPTGRADVRRRTAIAIYGLLAGTLQLARAVNDKRLSDEMLESGLRTALSLARLDA